MAVLPNRFDTWLSNKNWRLHPHQVAILEASDEATQLLIAPTGAGKTVVFASISKALATQDKNVLILVHRKELIDQASDKLSLIGVDH